MHCIDWGLQGKSQLILSVNVKHWELMIQTHGSQKGWYN